MKSTLFAGAGKASNAMQAEFKLYPTITEGVVYWQPGSNFPATGAILKVYDTDGRTVLTKEYGRGVTPLAIQTLHLELLVSGHYLIQIIGEGFSENVKVIVK